MGEGLRNGSMSKGLSALPFSLWVCGVLQVIPQTPVVSSQEGKFCEIGSLRSAASRHCPLGSEGAGNQLHQSLQVCQLINIVALRVRRKLLNKEEKTLLLRFTLPGRIVPRFCGPTSSRPQLWCPWLRSGSECHFGWEFLGWCLQTTALVGWAAGGSCLLWPSS